MPFENPDSFLPTLLSAIEQRNYDAVICVDEPARALLYKESDHHALQPYLPFPKDSGLFEASTDKVEFHKWCVAHSIPVPKAYIAENISEIMEHAAKIGYPLVLKGAVGSGGKTVFVLNSETELEQQLESLDPSISETWVVQEYSSGPLGSTTFICKDGKVYAHCSSEKFACLAGGLGPSALRQFTKQHALGEICKQIANAGKISGITGFDWIERSPGDYRLIDPHLGRCTTTVPAMHLEGIEVDQALYTSLTGGEEQPEAAGSGRIVWMMPQSIEFMFNKGFARALVKANPFRKDVSIFWCGKGEHRLFLRLVGEYFSAQIKILGGRLLRKIGLKS